MLTFTFIDAPYYKEIKSSIFQSELKSLTSMSS